MNAIKESIKRIVPHSSNMEGAKLYSITKKMLFYTILKLYCFFSKKNEDRVLLIAIGASKEQIDEIKSRCSFYIPSVPMDILEINPKKKLPWKIIFSNEPLLIFGGTESKYIWVNYCPGIFNVDYLCNPEDGWAWHNLIKYMSKRNSNYLLQSKLRFTKRIEELKKEQLNKCYIFGTGPSLDKAIDLDWSDGYRVVCNTIVRNPEIWEHINPHFIVAGDAIYHFGHTSFAKAFRKDLAKRLSVSKTMFLYPDIFHEFILREFNHISNQLIPIPTSNHKKINVDLSSNFELPGIGNILGLMLLPVGCTLSKNVYLFGFDGRAPHDKLFWSNSKKHSYPEFVEELQNAHPCFFEYYVPKNNPYKYIKEVHGDSLDECMTAAESEGWLFIMMHKSWTTTLQKRFIK